jgi:hypothetical protein
VLVDSERRFGLEVRDESAVERVSNRKLDLYPTCVVSSDLAKTCVAALPFTVHVVVVNIVWRRWHSLLI